MKMKTDYLHIPGFEIAYKAWGDANNPPILALHGWLDNAATFDWLAKLLAKDYYFIAIDLPGHGLSSHLALGCHYHFCDGIFTVVEVIKALGFDKIHLLGHSMGACLASLIAGVAPQKIISLALIEGLGPFSSPEETACAQLKDYLKYQIHDHDKPFRGYKNPHEAAQARAKRGHVSIKLAEKLCERGLKENDGLYYWRHDRRLLIPTPLRMTEVQILSCLENVKAQTCLIWAEDGFSFDTSLLKQRREAIAHLEEHQLQGGHHIHMEKPEKIAEILLKFYAKKNRVY